MRIRLRHPGGQVALSLPDKVTIDDLRRKIAEQVEFTSFDLKYGYPPKDLLLQSYSGDTALSALGVKFDGEQLIVSRSLPISPSLSKHEYQRTGGVTSPKSAAAGNIDVSQAPSTITGLDVPHRPLTGMHTTEQDPPELPIPELGGTILLRIMPDDNSCLFRAFNSAFFGSMDNMHELRSIIAQNVQADPKTYSAVILEQNPDDYCRVSRF